MNAILGDAWAVAEGVVISFFYPKRWTIERYFIGFSCMKRQKRLFCWTNSAACDV